MARPLRADQTENERDFVSGSLVERGKQMPRKRFSTEQIINHLR